MRLSNKKGAMKYRRCMCVCLLERDETQLIQQADGDVILTHHQGTVILLHTHHPRLGNGCIKRLINTGMMSQLCSPSGKLQYYKKIIDIFKLLKIHSELQILLDLEGSFFKFIKPSLDFI